MMLQHAVLAFSISAILAPFSYYAGVGARYLKLPQITGYLLSGIVCGPYLLGILSKESLLDLSIVEGACLSIIGLAAGAELDWPSLNRSRQQVLGITLGICVTTWVFCYFTFDWLGHTFELMPNMDAAHLQAVSTLGATLMMTRSPASAIAVLKEVDGKGPFSSLVMGVVVVKDVVVIMAYALNMELIRAVILPVNKDSGLQLINIVLPPLSVALSMGLGVFGGMILGAVIKPRPASHQGLLPASTHPSPEAAHTKLYPAHPRSKMAAILVISASVFQFAHYVDAEPLLACVTMGLILVNKRSDRDREDVHALITNIMGLTNVAFFGLAGASLKLSSLKDLLVPAVAVCVVRLAAIQVGSWAGCTVTGTHPEHKKLFWASQVTQAGVALWLARLAGTRFPAWGPAFQTYMMAIILVNVLVGPPLFRWALVGAGEARPAGTTSVSSGGTSGKVTPEAVTVISEVQVTEDKKELKHTA